MALYCKPNKAIYPAHIFDTLFNKVFTMCVKKGMVAGHIQAMDSAPVKANASMESIELKKPFRSIERHFEVVYSENQSFVANPSTALITAPQHQLSRVRKHRGKLRDNPVASVGASHDKAQSISNKSHYSPHDPDARISVEPGKARKFNYHCSTVVDTAASVMCYIQADFADGRDSQYLPGLSLIVKGLIRYTIKICAAVLLFDSGS